MKFQGLPRLGIEPVQHAEAVAMSLGASSVYIQVVRPVKYQGILMLIFGIYTRCQQMKFLKKGKFVLRLKTASVAQSVERWPGGPGSRVRFPAGRLRVAFLATGLRWDPGSLDQRSTD